MVSFSVSGAPSVVARAIEEHARTQGHVSAIVVPWESTPEMLSMSVTSVRIDGWAIEHINLGTLQLTGGAPDTTNIAAAPDLADHPDQQKLAAVFDRFIAQLQRLLPAGATP